VAPVGRKSADLLAPKAQKATDQHSATRQRQGAPIVWGTRKRPAHPADCAREPAVRAFAVRSHAAPPLRPPRGPPRALRPCALPEARRNKGAARLLPADTNRSSWTLAQMRPANRAGPKPSGSDGLSFSLLAGCSDSSRPSWRSLAHELAPLGPRASKVVSEHVSLACKKPLKLAPFASGFHCCQRASANQTCRLIDRLAALWPRMATLPL